MRHRPSLRAALRRVALLSTAALALAAPAGAGMEQAPNSRILLDLPAGYVPSAQFSGFQDEAHGASLVILEAPAKAFEELASGLTPEKLAARGIRDVTRGRLPRYDDHVYMRGRQTSPAGELEKFFVVFRAGDVSALVSANVPAAAIAGGSIKPDEIERILASAVVADVRKVRDLYHLTYLGPFREAGAVVGTSKIYTLDGRMEPERKGELRASFIVAPSLDLRPVRDLTEFATRLLHSLSGYTRMKAGEPAKVTIAGLPAVALEADAVTAEANGARPVRIYQVLLAGRDGGYYRMLGVSPAEDAARLLPELRRIAESFRLAE